MSCFKTSSKLSDFFQLVRPNAPRLDKIVKRKTKNRIGSCYKCKSSLGKGQFVSRYEDENALHSYVICPCCGHHNPVVGL